MNGLNVQDIANIFDLPLALLGVREAVCPPMTARDVWEIDSMWQGAKE